MVDAPTEISARLRRARKQAGFASANEAAERFGWGPSTYRHHENGTRRFGPDLAKTYGRAFRVKPGWLLGIIGVDGETVEPVALHEPLEVGGVVAAGVWREELPAADPIVIDLPPLLPTSKRLGYLVEGRSMDLVYEPGTVLDCVSVFRTDLEPQSGDHVIVRRTKPDGLREVTVKEFAERNGRYFLIPRSSVADYQEVEIGGPDPEIFEGEEIAIVAIVISSIPPRTLGLLRRIGKVKERSDG